MKEYLKKKERTRRSPLVKGRLHWLFDGSHPFMKCISLALILNLFVEMLCRRSLVEGFLHVIESPVVFLYNALIILLTLVPALFFKRQNFYLYLASVAWLGLGITNCVLLGMRTTPLSAIDFSILLSALNIVGIYLEPVQLVLIVAAILAAIALSVILFRHSAKMRPHYVRGAVLVSVTGVLLAIFTLLSVKSNVISTTFPSLAEAYDDYGFAYCFSVSVIDRGIDEPDDYDSDRVEEILDKLPETNETNAEELPNVIFIQVESFFDVNRLQNYVYTEDPVPYWTYLRENYPGGLLGVPSIGAGTANTEFEIISGMSLDYFGVGEYPYKTILKETPAESVAYNLKELGYSAHAVHNHTYDFYDRNFIYTHLGFDTFTPIEYMPNVERNFINWAKDSIIPREIMKALDSTEEKDLVYAITVQAHGKYPTDLTGYETDLDYVYSGDGEDPIIHEQFVYFLSELGESDKALKMLLDMLSEYDERTVVVIFGDHLPALDITDNDIAEGTSLDTEYVIWSNYGLECENRDLAAFQLNAHVLDAIGVNNGNVTKLHQLGESNDSYLSDLETLEYDMLYGERYAYIDNILPYLPTDIKYGVAPVEIRGVSSESNILHVYGSNFTEFSRIKIGGIVYDTVLISDSELMLISSASLILPEASAMISVAQVDSNGYVITETEGINVDLSQYAVSDNWGGILKQF